MWVEMNKGCSSCSLFDQLCMSQYPGMTCLDENVDKYVVFMDQINIITVTTYIVIIHTNCK